MLLIVIKAEPNVLRKPNPNLSELKSEPEVEVTKDISMSLKVPTEAV